MILVEGLAKRFGITSVLCGINFRVEPGQILALWGANGAGKTTTLKCLLGLVAFEGKVEVGGKDVRRAPREARRLMGYVPQEMPVSDLTAADALAFFADLRGSPAEQVRDVVRRAGFNEELSKPVRILSGGMRQRLAVALALLGDPPVLLLDEPTANLDEGARKDLLALLGRLRSEGRAMVLTSHRSEEVRLLADDVLVLENGRPRAVARAGEEVGQCNSGS